MILIKDRHITANAVSASDLKGNMILIKDRHSPRPPATNAIPTREI